MAKWVKVLVKLDDFSLIPRTHMAGEIHRGYPFAHTHTHTVAKHKQK